MQKFCFPAARSLCLLLYLVCLCVYKQTFSTPEITCKVLSHSIWCFRWKAGPEVTCYSLKWRTRHTQFPFHVRLSHFAPLSGMWDVSMAGVPISCTASVCSLLVRWASPHIIPASCLLYYFKLLWNMRLTIIWDMSWALLIWLCSAEPLTLPAIPHRGLPRFCCGLGCVSSRILSE